MPTDLTLYDLTQDLQALLDTEALVTEEQREQFEYDLVEAIKRSADKGERYGRFMASLDAAAEGAEKEVERLQARAAAFRAVKERVERCLLRVLESMPIEHDRKGKEIPRRLEAHTFTFSAYQKPASVEITDLDAIPDQFKFVTVEVIADVWAEHLQRYCELRRMFHDAGELDAPRVVREAKITYHAPKTPIKKAIEGGAEVPGADLKFGGYRLAVK